MQKFRPLLSKNSTTLFVAKNGGNIYDDVVRKWLFTEIKVLTNKKINLRLLRTNQTFMVGKLHNTFEEFLSFAKEGDHTFRTVIQDYSLVNKENGNEEALGVLEKMTGLNNVDLKEVEKSVEWRLFSYSSSSSSSSESDENISSSSTNTTNDNVQMKLLKNAAMSTFRTGGRRK